VQILLRGGGEPIEGTVHAFDNRINPASGTIRARAVLENEDGALLPGMFARVRLGSAERQKQILIDEKALGTDQSRKFVYVVDENNTAAYRQVEIGDRSGQKRVVLSGLEPGDKVIAEGLIRIRPGMEVEPMEKAAGE
jgi:multidrug efflux system membrane fusion protein